MYFNKYLKYKTKYLLAKLEMNGGNGQAKLLLLNFIEDSHNNAEGCESKILDPDEYNIITKDLTGEEEEILSQFFELFIVWGYRTARGEHERYEDETHHRDKNIILIQNFTDILFRNLEELKYVGKIFTDWSIIDKLEKIDNLSEVHFFSMPNAVDLLTRFINEPKVFGLLSQMLKNGVKNQGHSFAFIGLVSAAKAIILMANNCFDEAYRLLTNLRSAYEVQKEDSDEEDSDEEDENGKGEAEQQIQVIDLTLLNSSEDSSESEGWDELLRKMRARQEIRKQTDKLLGRMKRERKETEEQIKVFDEQPLLTKINRTIDSTTSLSDLTEARDILNSIDFEVETEIAHDENDETDEEYVARVRQDILDRIEEKEKLFAKKRRRT